MRKPKKEYQPKPIKKRRERKIPDSVLWQRRELNTDMRFVYDLAEALAQLDSDDTIISEEAIETAFKYYHEHGTAEVVDMVLKMHDELEKLGKR